MTRGLTEALGPRLSQGYTAVFLGQLRQGDYEICLWKLEYWDGGDDDLACALFTGGALRGFSVRTPSYLLAH